MSTTPSYGSPIHIAPTQAKDTALILVLAIVLGLFGLGWVAYFLYGQWQKGLVSAGIFLGIPLLIVVLGFMTCGIGFLILPFYGLLLVPVIVVNVIDAHLQNQRLREGFFIGQWTFFGQHL